jgi:acetyl esterase/lipase
VSHVLERESVREVEDSMSRSVYSVVASLLIWLCAIEQVAPIRLAVPVRELPVPDTVSPELQRRIALPVAPDIPMPTTSEGWKVLQLTVDAARATAAEGIAEKLGAKVEATKVAGVRCFRVTPKSVATSRARDLIVHVHGGGYVFNSGVAGTSEAVLLAEACRIPVLSIDYRMPPDHPFPAAPDDVMAVWKAVVADRDPRRVAMAGTSAGGGLIMTTMLRCGTERVARPAALFLGSPGADLSKTGDSLFVNAEVDHVLGRYEGRMEACIRLYAAGRDLKEPLISPIYGDFARWPPTILISGTRDLMLSGTVRTHRKLRAAAVPAELHVFEGMSHGDFLLSYPAPESLNALGEVAKFFERWLAD